MSATIALVDDDRNILTSVSIAMQAEGYVTRLYPDGEAALKALLENPADLGIFDIKMPRMDGLELLRRLREKSDMPVIFLTSKDEELDEALRQSRDRVATRKKPLPDDFARAQKTVKSSEIRGTISPSSLVGFLRSGDVTAYLIAISRLAGVDFETARNIYERRELDALAVICKAAGFEASLFLTFAVLILDSDSDAMAKARQYGQLYNDLPLEVAQRTIRFWQLRRRTGDVAVAA